MCKTGHEKYDIVVKTLLVPQETAVPAVSGRLKSVGCLQG